ncbi:FmdB family zinc ribbon protein [Nakamurella lactea]|uniref:FmdB family zinc ribbon protein n=1 Tax=Nakamurella lactea TaxID=459515 RepID=UPI00041C0B1B|nr:FmdB family zinc ribbon protein [Nakamurella lactea]
MPTYQYACTACEHRFEAVQKFTDDSLTVCPECAGSLRKVYGSIGVVFKGSGFYRTDSRGGPVAPGDGGAKSENSAEKASKPSEKSGSSSDGGSSGSGTSGSGTSASGTSGSGSSAGGASGASSSKSGSSSSAAGSKKSSTSAVPA